MVHIHIHEQNLHSTKETAVLSLCLNNEWVSYKYMLQLPVELGCTIKLCPV